MTLFTLRAMRNSFVPRCTRPETAGAWELEITRRLWRKYIRMAGVESWALAVCLTVHSCCETQHSDLPRPGGPWASDSDGSTPPLPPVPFAASRFSRHATLGPRYS